MTTSLKPTLTALATTIVLFALPTTTALAANNAQGTPRAHAAGRNWSGTLARVRAATLLPHAKPMGRSWT
jgi:hypothetical protein